MSFIGDSVDGDKQMLFSVDEGVQQVSLILVVIEPGGH